MFAHLVGVTAFFFIVCIKVTKRKQETTFSELKDYSLIHSFVHPSNHPVIYFLDLYGLLAKREVKMAGYWPSSVYGPRRSRGS